LQDLLRDPADRDSPLHVVALTLVREGTCVMAPAGDVELRKDDQLLLAGRLRDRAALHSTLMHEASASYAIDGIRVPSSWIWRRFARPEHVDKAS